MFCLCVGCNYFLIFWLREITGREMMTDDCNSNLEEMFHILIGQDIFLR